MVKKILSENGRMWPHQSIKLSPAVDKEVNSEMLKKIKIKRNFEIFIKI